MISVRQVRASVGYLTWVNIVARAAWVNGSPSERSVPTRAVISAINNMLIDLMAAMLHMDWLSRRQRQKQGIERAHTLGKYRGKQVDREQHQKVLYYRQVQKPSIRETAAATGYSPSQVCRIQVLYGQSETFKRNVFAHN